MNENLEQINNEQEKDFGGKNDILSLTVKTFYYAVVGLVFAAALFVVLFPYSTIGFYSDLGLKNRAYESAKSYVKLNEDEFIEKNPDFDSKYVDALLYCVNSSVSKMNNSVSNGISGGNTAKISKEADKYIEMFLSYQLDKRTKIIDDYSIKNTSPSFRPYVYSFKSDIESAQIRAKVFIGDKTGIGQILERRYNALNLKPLDGNYNIDDFIDMAGFFRLFSNYLNAHLITGDAPALLVENNTLSGFYSNVENLLIGGGNNAKAYITGYDYGNSATNFLKKLYCFRLISESIESLKTAFEHLVQNGQTGGFAEKLDLWTMSYKMPSSIIENKTMGEYLNMLVYQYSQAVNVV